VTGLGPTTGGSVSAGQPSPSSPLASVVGAAVFIGPTNYAQSAIIVNSSYLAPGLESVYQINLTIPGFHMNGNALPITVRIGNVNSPTTGPVVPYAALN